MGFFSRTLPSPLFNLARGCILAVKAKPQVGRVDFGQLRRTRPICSKFGASRGQPIDRFYIEQFLGSCSSDIQGHVLEIGENTYTHRFGGSRVKHSDILHISNKNPRATIVASLEHAPQIPDATFDCIILTQTLQLIFRLEAAIYTVHRILKPGGRVLITVPGITQIDAGSEWGPTWYWSFTDRSVIRLLVQCFNINRITCHVHGNVLAATSQLQGLAASELTPDELADTDTDYQVIITARAAKDEGT
jgi:SAM-dependent methyltransferase